MSRESDEVSGLGGRGAPVAAPEGRFTRSPISRSQGVPRIGGVGRVSSPRGSGCRCLSYSWCEWSAFDPKRC